MGCGLSKDIFGGCSNLMCPNNVGSYFDASQNKRILEGLNVLVTGGNRGVGKELVRKFASEGANVIFNSSKFDSKAKDYSIEIATAYGVECIYTKCDIRFEKEIDAMCQLALEKFKRIDILINNAGRTCFGDVENLKLEDYNDCMAINLTAPLLFSQKLIPAMKQNKWGRIINFGSAVSQKPQPNILGYVAAKNGLNALTKVLAKEVGEFKITANCVIPGCVDTDMFNDGVRGFAASLGASPEMIKSQFLGVHIIKEAIQPTTLSSFCLYLCSEEGAALTGGLFPVDHGFTA